MSSFSTTSPTIANGSRVAFVNLVSRADLNGTTGIVKSFEADRQRFHVCVATSDESVFVKESNLEYVGPSSTDTTDPMDKFVATMQEVLIMDHDDKKIQQYMIVGGVCATPVDLGYFPIRLLAARIHAETFSESNLTSLASASFPALWQKNLSDEVERSHAKISRYATRFDKSNAEDRSSAVSALSSVLAAHLSLLYGLGETREGKGFIAIEAQGTMQQIFNGFLGKGKSIPIVAAYLTHKQSIPWYESTIGVCCCSKSDAHKHALEQVGKNEKFKQQVVTFLSLHLLHILTYLSSLCSTTHPLSALLPIFYSCFPQHSPSLLLLY